MLVASVFCSLDYPSRVRVVLVLSRPDPFGSTIIAAIVPRTFATVHGRFDLLGRFLAARRLLAEHVVDLVDGEFQEKNSLKIQRLEDQVQFLCRRFSKTKVDRTAGYWSEFAAATKLRDELTHPKADPAEHQRTGSDESPEDHSSNS
jgi:hypothetical protein